MASFGELLLYLFVNLNITLQRLDLSGHFIVFEKQLLGLFGLVFEFRGQLMILKNGQTSSSLKLLIIKSQKIGLSLFDLVEHLFS